MKIATDKELTASELGNLLRAGERDAEHKRQLKRYYLGEMAIGWKVGRTNTDINNRLTSNYCSYIVNTATGFFLGKPLTYQSARDISGLLDIFKYNDESAHNLQLAEEAAITGAAYEILYLDGDAQIRLACVPSEQIILVTDATLEENVRYAVRRYGTQNFDGTRGSQFVDVYDAQNISRYSFDGALKLIERQRHYFDDVPIVEYANNGARRGDFEDVLSLVDAYNKAQSLTLDDMEDFTDAFLILKGLGGTTPEDVRELRRNKVISLDDGGDAQWLIKNLNDSYIENMKSRLQRDIHKFSNVPDMTDENFAGNVSGVAIAYKLIGLEHIRSRKEREFKKGLQRRIELIGGVMKLKSRQPIDFRDVTMQFTANLPQDVQALAQVVNQLDGLVSRKTLLGLLPFVEDVDGELKEMEEDGRDYEHADYEHADYEHAD